MKTNQRLLLSRPQKRKRTSETYSEESCWKRGERRGSRKYREASPVRPIRGSSCQSSSTLPWQKSTRRCRLQSNQISDYPTRTEANVVLTVGNQRVGVLQEGDGHQPVVDVKVRDQVVVDDLREGSAVGPGAQGTKQEGDSDVRRDDLSVVSLVEDDGVGVEVVGEPGVVLLTRGVSDQVQRPAEELQQKIAEPFNILVLNTTRFKER